MMGAVAKIPVIDIAGGGDQTKVARELVDAAVEHGFIYIKSTGVDFPPEAIEDAFNMVLLFSSRPQQHSMLTLSQSRKLFAAPVEDKARCKIQQNNRGWAGMQVETLDPKTQRVSQVVEVGFI